MSAPARAVVLTALALGCAPEEPITEADASRLDARPSSDLAGDRPAPRMSCASTPRRTSSAWTRWSMPPRTCCATRRAIAHRATPVRSGAP
ncbi:MAG: hypothetical protein IPF99_11800 [Deltaproteobacteria bacterium]|nr:hypothetical protein [Deltaproteobacteria bacterium]